MSWWLQNLQHCSAPICRPNPHHTLYTEAATAGWGTHCSGISTGGHFSEKELPLSINTKETLAILYGFHSFADNFKNSTVLIQSDSTTAFSYVKHFGGMKSELQTKIVQDLWEFANDIHSWIKISHITGQLNWEADLASWVLNPRSEWQVPPSIFKQLCAHFKVSLTVDLFPSQLNHKLPRYHSFTPDLFCEHVNTFTSTWNENMYYIFCPFNLLHRALQKLCCE